MTEKVDRTYLCDLTGKEIDNVWDALSIDLDRGQDIKTIPNRTAETIHIHPDEHDIQYGNSETRELDVTAYVTESAEIPRPSTTAITRASNPLRRCT